MNRDAFNVLRLPPSGLRFRSFWNRSSLFRRGYPENDIMYLELEFYRQGLWRKLRICRICALRIRTDNEGA
jgi:hypothetical protein